MPKRPLFLFDIKTAIHDLQNLHAAQGRQGLSRDRMLRLAFERCFEIVSEASRRIPDAWKAEYPTIEWPQIAALGNRLRHNYDIVDLETLAVIVEDDLPALADAIERMIAKYDVEDGVAPPTATKG